MASSRDVDDILAELLAGDEAPLPEPALPEPVRPAGPRLSTPTGVVNAATASADAATAAASQPAATGSTDAGVDHLFGELLNTAAHTTAEAMHDAAKQNRPAEGGVASLSGRGASTAGVQAPAAEDASLLDLLDSLLGTEQPATAEATAVPAHESAKADDSSVIEASDVSAGTPQHMDGQHRLQQMQQGQDIPFAASAAADALVAADSRGSNTVPGAQQQQPQLFAPSTAVGPHKEEAAAVSPTANAGDALLILPTAAAAENPSAPEPAAAVTNDSSSGSDDDDMMDMLHDMAEVLEVQETTASAPEQASSVSTPAAAVAVSPSLQAAAGARGTSSSESGSSANKAVSTSDSSSFLSQQEQQLDGSAALHTSAGFSVLFEPSPSAAGQPSAPAAAGGAAGELPAHELALQQAWQYEETLFHGGLVPPDALDTPNTPQQQEQQQSGAKRRRLEPLPRLKELLADARLDWNPAGRPDGSGSAMIGGSVLLKLESLAGLFAGAAGMGAGGRSSSSGGGGSGGGGGGGVDWAHVLAAALAPHGPLQVVAASGPYVAVGSAAGSALVLQLPTSQQNPQTQGSTGLLNPSNPQNPSQQHGHNTLPGGAAMWQLGEGILGDGVTCLGFSVVTTGSDALWLAVGHESGALTVWEVQKRGPRQVAAVAQHGSRLTFASFLPGRSTSLLLSADSRGRLCLHTFSNLLLRTNVSSKVLVNGQYGALLGISHLTPFTMPAPALSELGISSANSSLNHPGQPPSPTDSAGQLNPSSAERVSPRRLRMGGTAKAAGTPPLSPKLGGRMGGAAAGGDEALWRAFFEDGGWRVGEGVFCLLTPSHVYIARLKPLSNDLIMLFSIPQPSPGPQAAVPVAAWLPHNRKPQSAGFRVHSDSSGGSAVNKALGSGAMAVPVAVLALGWGSRLVMFEVPLLGDHLSLAAALAPDTAASAATALAAAAGQLRRGGPSSFISSRASQKAQQTLESLNPTTAAQIAGYFPLSMSGTWMGGPHHRAQSQSQGSGLQQGSRGQGRQYANGHADSGSSSSSGGSSFEEPVLGPTEPIPILGAHWLDADAVAVVCQQGFSSLLLVLGYHTSTTLGQVSNRSSSGSSSAAVIRVQEQVEWMDQPVDRQWAVSGGLAAWGVDCQGSVVGVGPRVYLLGQQGGVFCGRLMPWSERLKTLQDVRKFKLGLFYALKFQQTSQQQQIQPQQQPGHQRRNSNPTGSDTAGSGGGSAAAKRLSAGGGLARSEGVGAEPQQVEQWMLSLMLGHATVALQAAHKQQQLQAGNHTSYVQQPSVAVRAAAEICVCLCLLLSRVDVLFERVYPLFSRSGSAGVNAGGAVGAVVEVLELAVLSDLLESLPPEIMQALVDHFAEVGQPERVEGCVLHLSIMSLDLNQVIRLCESVGLYSALTSIYNHIGDYRKPLLDLLAAVAGAGSFAEAHRYCCKLLVYLRCCFRGLKFPPGTGYLSSTGGSIDSIKSALLGSLLYLDRQDLITEWQQSGGRAATAAALITTSSSNGPTQGSTLKSLMFCAGLSDPHPALQLLLSVDVAAAVAVLSEMTCGWDAVETDLRVAAGKPAAELDSVLVATQVVVNSIIALLEAGKFDQWSHMHGGSGGSSGSGNGQPSGSSVAMSYIIDLLAAGRVTVKPAFALRLLEYNVNQAAAAAAAAADNDDHSRSSCAAVTLQRSEQQFIDILNVVGVDQRAAAGPQSQQQQQSGHAGFSMPQAHAALRLANKAGYVKAAATIHHMQGDCERAIAALLKLSQQQQQQQQQQAQGADVFQYLSRLLSSSSSSTKKSMAAVMRYVDQLIRLDAAATAALLLQHQPDYQVPVLLSLQQQPHLQFTFLRAAMQQAMHIQQNAQQAAAAAAADSDPAAAAEPNASATAAADKLLERSEVADLYVRLLAKFDPSAVMPFLQSHHHYNVAAAIKACAAAGVSDAEAFLHERLGDLDAALQLYLSAVAAANTQLAAALAVGSMPIMLLPNHHPSSSSSGEPRDSKCRWGLGALLDEIAAAAAAARAPAPAAAAAGVQADAIAGAGIQSEQCVALEESAAVAASLLQLLSPAAEHEDHGSTTAAAASALLPAASNASAGLGQQQSLQQQQQQRPTTVVCTDLYKSWMAELSPRLKLKGLGMSCSSSSSSTGQRTQSTTMGSCYSSAAVAAVAAAAAVPDELLKAWQVLQSAIAFCQRNTKTSSSSSSSSKDYSESGSGKYLWFSVMEAYVGKLRSVQGYIPGSSSTSRKVGSRVDRDRVQQQQQPGLPQQQQQQQELLSSLAAAAAGQLNLHALPAVLQSAAAAAAAAATHDLFRLLLDELVCVMADHLPLLDIVSRVLQEHGTEQFGEFRSTLLGLFGATAYESAIMVAANRLITGDAFTAVRRAYTLRTLARAAQQQQQQQSSDQEAASSTSSSQQAVTSSLTAAAAPVLEPPPGTSSLSIPINNNALKTAQALGILRSVSSSSTVASSSSSTLRSLTQQDKDMITGVLGHRLMHLHLQPAGPAAAHLPGVAAEYRAAARKAQLTKRVFKGEIDLAVEISLLHQQQQQQHVGLQQQQRQYYQPEAAGSWIDRKASTGSPQQQQQQWAVGSTTAVAAAAAVGPPGTSSAGGVSSPRESFDIDELLDWSTNNMS